MIEVLRFLAVRAVAGVEAVDGSRYRRSLELAGGAAVAEVSVGGGAASEQRRVGGGAASGQSRVGGGAASGQSRATGGEAASEQRRTAGGGPRIALRLEDERDRPDALARCRRLLDLGADTARVDEVLGRDPLLAPLVRRRPGLRVPRATDGFELAVRAVIGQQVTLAAARRTAGRLVALYGRRLEEPAGAITHLFPTPAAVAEVDSLELRMPRVRASALRALARAVLDGELDLSPGADRAAARRALLELPGIGPWTASYVCMRALGDSDAFPPGDAAVRRALERLGQDGRPAAARRLAERWRPWRSYALVHLWRVNSPRARFKDGQPRAAPAEASHVGQP